MLQAAAEVVAEVIIPEAPAAQALLEVIITIKKMRDCLLVPTITLTVIHTHKDLHLIRLLQSVLSTRHTLISFPH